MARTFKNFEAFKKSSPENASKIDFERFKAAAIA
jgi:hypothetical protein